ncbi:hypothetical protein OY671_012640, partial [Metschnikowia pulcherrima]
DELSPSRVLELVVVSDFFEVVGLNSALELEEILELDRVLDLDEIPELDEVLELARESITTEGLDALADIEIVDSLEEVDESIITEGLCEEDESEPFVAEESELAMVEDLAESLSVLEAEVEVDEARGVVVTLGKE